MLKILPAIFIVLFMQFNNINAQDKDFSDFSYGLFCDLTNNFDNANFHKLNNIPNCCPLFQSGYGMGFDFGGHAKYLITQPAFIALRIGYFNISSTLISMENSPGTSIIYHNSLIQADIKHELDAYLSKVSIELLYGYNIWKEMNLITGLNFSSLIDGKFDQKEVLENPTDAVFSNSSRLRNVYTNVPIPNLSSLIMGVEFGVDYNLPLNKSGTWRLCPEIIYEYTLNNITSDVKWKVNTLRLGAKIEYRPIKEMTLFYEYKEIVDTVKIEVADIRETIIIKGQETVVGESNEENGNKKTVIRTIRRTDTMYVEKPVQLWANIIAKGVNDTNDVDSDIAIIQIEEFFSINMRPLLNYIFFDFRKYDLPERYIKLSGQDTSNFFVDRLNNISTMPTYYQVLNIIGRRMKEHPKATIRIVGSNQDKSDGTISQGKVAELRVESIFSYLNNVWGIDTDRMRKEYRILPEKPSNIGDVDGINENRRTEIFSDDWEILKPILTFDTLRALTPPILRFYIDAKSLKGIKSWTMTALQRGKILKIFKGTGKPPNKIDWNPAREQENVPKFDEPLNYNLSIEDSSGETFATGNKELQLKQIKLNHKIRNQEGDKEVDRFSLILFDVNDPRMNDNNQNVLNMIKTFIKSNSVVKIEGHTDRMGDQKSNMKLSKDRAFAVKQSLDFSNSTFNGKGEDDLLFDNDLPEGRFYCRTVNITVETPINYSEINTKIKK